MKNKLLLLFLMLFVSFAGRAQQATPVSYTIKGVLLDSLTQEGEPYATVRIVKKDAPAKALKMAVTDAKGKFQEKMNAAPGAYTVLISSIGKTTVVKDFTIQPSEKVVDLGTLYTAEATNELKGIEVIAQKPLVKADVDKIEYNVQDDPDSKSNNILEMLRKVPLVTVDGEDKIKVNGSSSFKIHVNGRPDKMISDNPVDVLKSMPASTIKHIEVITNPGAKYDAEGIGGILNIVTIGSGFEGYTATFSGNASNYGGGGSVYATIKKEKLTLSGRYNYNLNSSPRYYSNSTQENLTDGTVISSENSSKNKGQFQHGNIEASYEIDTLRLITMGFGLYGGGNDGTGNGSTVMNPAAPATDPLYSYLTHNENDGSWYSIRGNIDYQRVSRLNKDRMFTFSYNISTRPSSNDSRYWYSDQKWADDSWKDYINTVLLNQRSDGSQNSSEHTFQADYTTPIAKIHTLETGVKYIIRNNTSDNNRYNSDDNTLDVYRSSHYKHLNDILAAYFGYGIKVKSFSGKAGVRYERTMQDVSYAETPERDFNVDFNDVVPSASFGFKLNQLSNIRMAYNMRIFRPSIWYLNPYLDDTNPAYIRQGNSTLDSEKSHAFNISYSNFTQKFNINISARYSFNNNSIENVTTLMNDKDIPGLKQPTGKEVLYSTYQNIGKSSYGGLSGYVNWNASPKTRIYVNFSVDYAKMKSPAQNLENSGWNCFAYGGVQQTLPLDIRVSLNLMGQTPYISLQGKGSSFYDYGLNVNKSFLKEKRLTLSVFANNFLEKYRSSENSTEGNGFRSFSHSDYPSRRFGMSVSYRIGELKASVKKAARSINNDDVKGGGGGEGGGK